MVIFQPGISIGFGEERVKNQWIPVTFHYTICTKLHLVHFITSSLSIAISTLNTYFHLLLKFIFPTYLEWGAI